MLLRDPNRANIQRWLEDAGNYPRGFGDMMIPRGKVELPNFTHVALSMAQMAQKEFGEGSTVPRGLAFELVREAWMGALRLLELAALDGEREGDEAHVNQAIADKEMRELITKLTQNTSAKKSPNGDSA
jgi:hypothetical protein